MPTSSIARTLSLFFTPQALVPFFFGTVCITLIGSACYDLLVLLMGTSAWAYVALALGAIAILYVATLFLHRYANKVKWLRPLPGKKRPLLRQGLILLVSRRETCEVALQWHMATLRYVWLIHSTKTAGLAEELKQELKAENVQVFLHHITDLNDLLAYMKTIEGIYADLPGDLRDEDVIMDYTGMGKNASVGSVLACLDRRRALQYVPARYNDMLNPEEANQPIEIELDWGDVRLPDETTGE